MAVLGVEETRPFAAADYYRKGLAHKILVSNVRARKVETFGVSPLQADLNRPVLIKSECQPMILNCLGKSCQIHTRRLSP